MLFKVYVMLFEDLINKISLKLEEKLSDRFLISIQESLLRAGLFALASHFIAEILLIIIVLLLLFVSVSLIFSFSLLIAVMLAISIPIAISVAYVMIKTEQRAMQIENSIPDFLRQLASMLRVGLSLENALLDLSKHGNGPLYDELRRVVVEVRMGRGFDEAFENMAVRLNSQNLQRSFKIILNSYKSGGGLADVIEDVSEDLRAMLILKRERKSSVMMSVMFLVLASVVAAPFALGMVGVYSSFMMGLGRASTTCQVAPLAAEIYLIIHSVFAGFLIALVMYDDLRKGVKFSIPITLVAFLIFYGINTFGLTFFGF